MFLWDVMVARATEHTAPARITFPSLPSAALPQRFPVVASVAPVIMSLAMWLLTQSVYALLFAVLGPVVAIASVADNRLASRRRLRDERRRFWQQLDVVSRAIATEHERERAQLALRHPDSLALVAAASVERVGWSKDRNGSREINLGKGIRQSELQSDGSPPAAWDASDEARAIAECRASLISLSEAPVIVDVGGGIGVVGPPGASQAVARSVIIQLAALLSPADYVLEHNADGEAWAWLGVLPHSAGSQRVAKNSELAFTFRSRADEVDRGADEPVCFVTVAESRSEIRQNVDIFVHVDGFRGSIGHASARHPSARHSSAQHSGATGDFLPDRLTVEHVTGWAKRAAEAAELAGLCGVSRDLVSRVEFVDVDRPVSTPPCDSDTLLCGIALNASDIEVLDIVRDGPHAIVGGMTGTGKSELLTTWVLSIASNYSPSVANFLFVDFKGGATFAGLATLPHSVGMISDLDVAGAERAISSLAAELRAREHLLRAADVRDIADLPAEHATPRLIIVVDEFAVLANEFPELSNVFADLAARGRSLGIHLILCTQRPSSSIREAILANAGIRISLRVNNRADSVSVIGTAAAATLPAEPRGRALISRASAPPIEVQVAVAGPEDVAAVAERWVGHPFRPRRPWLDPLPSTIPLDLLRSHDRNDGTVFGGIAFGLTDEPENQSQPQAQYCPDSDGHLLVFGGMRSGKSNLVTVIAAQCTLRAVHRISTDIEVAWDQLERAHELFGSLVIIDDLDATLSKMPDEYVGGFVDRVSQLLRDAPTNGVHAIVTAQRLTPPLHALLPLFDSRMIFRMPNRQEHVIVGGASQDFDAERPPGAAQWHGHRVQVALAPPGSVSVQCGPVATTFATLEHRHPLTLVVASNPERAAMRLRGDDFFGSSDAVVHIESTRGSDPRTVVESSAGLPRALVGDVDTWQYHAAVVGALRSRAQLIFAQCTVAEFRVMTRIRALPPLIADPRHSAWLLDASGEIHRVSIAL